MTRHRTGREGIGTAVRCTIMAEAKEGHGQSWQLGRVALQTDGSGRVAYGGGYGSAAKRTILCRALSSSTRCGPDGLSPTCWLTHHTGSGLSERAKHAIRRLTPPTVLPNTSRSWIRSEGQHRYGPLVACLGDRPPIGIRPPAKSLFRDTLRYLASQHAEKLSSTGPDQTGI